MKQILLIVGLIVVAGGAYWLFANQSAVEESAATMSDEQEEGMESTMAEVEGSDYVGLTTAEAEAMAAENDVQFRVVERDGAMVPTTKDYGPGRINAVVVEDVVTTYTVEGEGESSDGDMTDRAVDSNKEGDPNANKYDFGGPVTNDETDDGGNVASGEALEAAPDSRKQGDPDANRYDFGEPITNDETDDRGDAAGEHDAIIGLTQAEAEAYAEMKEVPFRIGSVDGEARPVTMDYRPGRITASLEAGVVTDYSVE